MSYFGDLKIFYIYIYIYLYRNFKSLYYVDVKKNEINYLHRDSQEQGIITEMFFSLKANTF